MADATTKFVQWAQQRGYVEFESVEFNGDRPTIVDVISHDTSKFIGPNRERMPVLEVFGSGERIEDKYHQGAGDFLSHDIARFTRGRFPERWQRVYTGNFDDDRELVQKIVRNFRGQCDRHLTDDEKDALSIHSQSTYFDVICVASKASNIIDMLPERLGIEKKELASHLGIEEVHAWDEKLESVVDAYTKGVNIARVNIPLGYDSGNMLAHIIRCAWGSGVCLGTAPDLHPERYEDVRDDFEPVETILNQLPLEEGAWVGVRHLWPFKATQGVMAELLVRDGQQSKRVWGTDRVYALSNKAMLGHVRANNRIYRPRGEFRDGVQEYPPMEAGQITVRGYAINDSSENGVSVRPLKKYSHLRVMSGDVSVTVRDTVVDSMLTGGSILILPDASAVIKSKVPRSLFSISTLHLPKRAMR